VDAVRFAAEDVRRGVPAAWFPIVLVGRHGQALRRKGAQGGRASDLCVGTRTAKPATEVLAVGLAAQHAIRARGIPKVRRDRIVVELASVCGCDNVTRVVRAGDRAIVWVLAAEAALGALSICQAADLAQGALRVPIVRQVRRVVKLAPRSRAMDALEIPCAAEAALRMDAVCQATQGVAVVRAALVPEVRDQRFVGEAALAL